MHGKDKKSTDMTEQSLTTNNQLDLKKSSKFGGLMNKLKKKEKEEP